MAGTSKYKNKWISENCDRICLILPKGCKAEVQAHAKIKGMSMNAYIKDLIEKDGRKLEMKPTA